MLTALRDLPSGPQVKNFFPTFGSLNFLVCKAWTLGIFWLWLIVSMAIHLYDSVIGKNCLRTLGASHEATGGIHHEEPKDRPTLHSTARDVVDNFPIPKHPSDEN